MVLISATSWPYRLHVRLHKFFRIVRNYFNGQSDKSTVGVLLALYTVVNI